MTLLLGVLVAAPSLWGQSQSINGTIRGRVTDPSNAAVSGAKVTVSNPTVGFTRTAETSGDGYYVLINLPLGTYTVNFDAAGFSPLNVQKVTLNAGTEAQIDGALTIGGDNSAVTVTAAEVVLDPTNLNVQRTLDTREIENAPLTSRNPYNFILFQPGVSGHPNQELGIPRTINTNGLMDRINYQMDGMVNTEADRIGLRLFPIANIFVKEVQTVSNSFAPEFGWTTGDVYNVISGSGSNAYHGQFLFIKRWLDATAFPLLTNKKTTPVKPNLELTDYAFNVGGRVIKDKLFFFGAYEHVLRGSPSSVTISTATANAAGINLDELQSAPGLLHGTFTLQRVDWNITPKHTLTLRYNYFRNFFPLNNGVGSTNARSAGADYKDRAHVWGVQLISTLTDHLLNEFRFSAPFRNNVYIPNPQTGAGPQIVLAANSATNDTAATFGGTSSAGAVYSDRQPSGSDNISYIHGAHTFKAGVIVDQLENKQRQNSYQRYSFNPYSYTVGGVPTTVSPVQAYLKAKNGVDPYSYSTYTSQTDVNGVGYASLFFGGFAQDTWQLTPKLVAVYGLRYDRFLPPNSDSNALWADSRKFNSPAANFGPRVGFSYRAASGTIAKISGGLFYGQPPTNNWYNALYADGSNKTSLFTYTVNHTGQTSAVTPSSAYTPGAPAYPSTSASTGTVAKQNVTTINPNIKNEYTWNINAQIQQQLSAHESFTLGYIMASARNMLYIHNINLINPIGYLADGRPVYSTTVSAATRLNPTFDQVNRLESGANSSFNAMFANFTMKPRRGMQINANYTWSHSISTAPDVNSFEQSVSISDPSRPKFDRGNSVVNRPNAFNLTAVLEPTFNFANKYAREVANHNMLAILGNISSGDQANITSSTSTLNGDAFAAAVQRPAFVGRNSIRNPMIKQIDARYTRTFPTVFHRLAGSFFLEANNIFNSNNLTGATITQAAQAFSTAAGANNTNAGVATGTLSISPTTVLEARIIQYGVKVTF